MTRPHSFETPNRHKEATKNGGEEMNIICLMNGPSPAKLTAARKCNCCLLKVMSKIHQVGTDASRDAVTQAEYR